MINCCSWYFTLIHIIYIYIYLCRYFKPVRLWPRGVPTPSTDIGLPPLLAAISPLSIDLRAGWTNNVRTVNLSLGYVAERIALFYSFI